MFHFDSWEKSTKSIMKLTERKLTQIKRHCFINHTQSTILAFAKLKSKEKLSYQKIQDITNSLNA